MTPSFRVTPDGFERTLVGRRPIRCKLLPFTRLLKAFAVTENDDEYHFYTGVIGKIQETEPGLWNVPLIALDSVVMQAFVANNLPMPSRPSPAGIAPLQPVSRYLLTPSTPFNVANAAPDMTFETWWKSALQADSMSEYGVGPDLVFTAGSPVMAQNVARYALDWRAQNLTAQGNEIPPYLTLARGFIPADYVRDQGRPAGSAPLPRFTPIRTATYGRSLEVQREEVTLSLSAYGAGSPSVTGRSSSGTGIGAFVPPVSGAIQAASLTGSIQIDMLQSQVGKVAVIIRGSVSGLNGVNEVMNQTNLAAPGTFLITLNADAGTLEGCTSLTMEFGLQGLTDDAQASASVSAGGAWVKYQETTQNTSWQAPPNGLEYPILTEEAWSFTLPGLHAGPLLVTDLPNGEQYATTIIRIEPGENGRPPELFTDVRCGPLPYASSPIDKQGQWRDSTAQRYKVKL